MSFLPHRPRAKTPTSGVIMEALFLAAGLVTSALGVLALSARRERTTEKPAEPEKNE